MRDLKLILDPYLIEKPTATMVTDRKLQDARRKFRNTYQLG